MSKNIAILILVMLVTCSATAQSTADLDSIYGFRQFRFRVKPSQLKDIRPIPTLIYHKDFVREYEYTGTDIAELNTVKISRVVLSFYQNRLFGIRICYDSSVHINDDFDKIQYVLSAQYGAKWTPTPSENNGITGRTWKGQKVSLDNIMNASGYGYINVLERRIYKEMMADK